MVTRKIKTGAKIETECRECGHTESVKIPYRTVRVPIRIHAEHDDVRLDHSRVKASNNIPTTGDQVGVGDYVCCKRGLLAVAGCPLPEFGCDLVFTNKKPDEGPYWEGFLCDVTNNLNIMYYFNDLIYEVETNPGHSMEEAVFDMRMYCWLEMPA